MRTLLLYSNYTDQMSYYDDWTDAFKHHPYYDMTCINVYGANNNDLYKKVCRLIDNVQLIILHHTMNASTLKYLFPFVDALKNRMGKLVSFVGNEVNLLTMGMAPKIKMLKELEPDIIATQLLPEAGQWLYKDCDKSLVVSLPHGLNPNAFKKAINTEDRTIDIGARSVKYGVYIGDNDRNGIIQYFFKNPHGLVLDLGLNDGDQKRFDRKGWADFLNNCKSTLSTEAGSFFLEPDDKIITQIHQYLKSKSSKLILDRNGFLRKYYRLLIPLFIRKRLIRSFKKQILVEAYDVDEDADFLEIYNKFFANADKAPVYTKAISSRHFDAIGTHTLNVMYPGRYNDILRPHEHYFELKKDHSNVDDLLALLKDSKKISSITSEAYDYVLRNHTHKHRLDTLLSYL